MAAAALLASKQWHTRNHNTAGRASSATHHKRSSTVSSTHTDVPATIHSLSSNAVRRAALSVSTSARRAHLIGIGGAGMRSLAHVLAQSDWQVTGSDADAETLGNLMIPGCRIRAGHSAGNITPSTQLVVYSDAVPRDNAERRRAAELGISQLSYPQMLGRLMNERVGVTIAGTHGKSTTAAMAADIFICAGYDPTVVFGAERLGEESGGRHGRSDLVLVEACEYRRNFLHLRPQAAVLLGIEDDHFDCYRSPGELTAAFSDFARSVPSSGLLLVNGDCPRTLKATKAVSSHVRTFGLGEGADWRAVRLRGRLGRYCFEVQFRGRRFAEVSLQVPGAHNVQNALAAAAITAEYGVCAADVKRALAEFRGLRRRLEPLGAWRGVTIVDDYAHHPTAVRATLAATREMYPTQRVCCVFQPHQIARTRHLLDELAHSLQNADCVLVTRVHVARERATPAAGGLADELARRIRLAGTPAIMHDSVTATMDHLTGVVVPGDVVVTIGAGNIRNVCDGFVNRLRRNRAA